MRIGGNMKLGLKKAIVGVLGATVLCLTGMVPAIGQSSAPAKPAASKSRPAPAPAAEKQLLAEDVF